MQLSRSPAQRSALRRTAGPYILPDFILNFMRIHSALLFGPWQICLALCITWFCARAPYGMEAVS
jgi:hypothetical protein